MTTTTKSSSSTTTTTMTAWWIQDVGMTISMALFGMSAMYFMKYHQHQRQKRNQLQQPFSNVPFYQRRQKSLQQLQMEQQQHDRNRNDDDSRSSSKRHDPNDASPNATTTTNTTTKISPRGQMALLPVIPIQKQFFAAFASLYEERHNPTGYIALCVAENKLIINLLVQRCTQSASAAFVDAQVYGYNSFLGMPIAREATAYFLQRWFLYPPLSSPLPPEQQQQQLEQHINPNHIALAAGAAAILNNLFFCLGDVGDACLIPAPYYTAFENDMHLVAGIVPYAVHSVNPMHGPTESDLELAYLQCKATGLNPRFLLLTNPNNPLGIIYRPVVVQRCVTWARKRHLHTIMDEIYALSTHQKSGHEFKSIIQILDNQLGDDVHMVWAASKDFGCSGVRYGVLYTQNELLLAALQAASTFSCVSGPIQYLVSELLTDDVFVANFLDESRDRLVHSYTICTRKLDEMVLPFIPAEAGMFVYVDFSSILPTKTFEWEQKLSELFFQVRVILTPGESQHDATPGMFRLCYAWVSPEALEVAMERLSRLVAKVRRMDWDDINSRVVDNILSG